MNTPEGAGIINSQLLESLRGILSETDKAHDLSHIERVLQHARNIYQALIDNSKPEGNWKIIEAAIVLHETTKDKPDEKVRDILKQHDYSEDEIVEIVYCIGKHYDYENRPTTLEGHIVQDADICDMLGPIGIARAFMAAQAKGLNFQQAVEEYSRKRLKSPGCINLDETKELARDDVAFTTNYFTALDKALSPEATK